MEREAKYLVHRLDELELRLLEYYPEIEYKGTVHLPAIYYDTFDRRLERSKTALRVREEGGKLIGCYKATTREERVFVEEEVILQEEDITRDWFTCLKHYPELIQKIGNEVICPVVKIATERKIFLLQVQEMSLEIALDRVQYLEGLAFEERIEVEWKAGNEAHFEAFLHKFELEMGQLQETLVSKYQRAIEILRGHA